MQKEVNVTKCPYCQGEELVKANLSAPYALSASINAWHAASVKAIVCRDCGSIVRMFVEDPEKMFKKKDRRA